MKISGAIFDMDGTLLDSMFIWDGENVKRYALSCGITPRDDFGEKVKHMFLSDIVVFLKEEYGFSCTCEQLVEGIYSFAEELYRTEVLPKPGIIELLENYRQRGIKMCVATATEFYIAEMVLKKLDLLKYFSGILTCTMVGARKQQPVIYEAALELLGTTKSETPVFEDALYAIKTAKSAGFTVVGIYDKFYEIDQESIKALADIYIEDFHTGAALISGK